MNLAVLAERVLDCDDLAAPGLGPGDRDDDLLADQQGSVFHERAVGEAVICLDPDEREPKPLQDLAVPPMLLPRPLHIDRLGGYRGCDGPVKGAGHISDDRVRAGGRLHRPRLPEGSAAAGVSAVFARAIGCGRASLFHARTISPDQLGRDFLLGEGDSLEAALCEHLGLVVEVW